MRGGLLALAILLGALATPAQAANPWIEERAPLNIAHQGGEDEFPSNTMYAFRKALRAGADLPSTVVSCMTTTFPSRVTPTSSLDAAYWFAPGRADHYGHNHPRRAYRFRGIATGSGDPQRASPPPTSACPPRAGARGVPKDTDQCRDQGPYSARADRRVREERGVLTQLLQGAGRRRLIVVSFRQQAVDRFHELAPKIDLAPGIDGAAGWILGGRSPGPGVVAFGVPITFKLGETLLEVTTRENVARAHAEGYAWQNWFSGDDRDAPATWRRLVAMCVDGIMTSRPRALGQVLDRTERPPSCG
jgi:glycerophosphoryl diester phosphodiesterase